mgnify:CR=1 FL=1
MWPIDSLIFYQVARVFKQAVSGIPALGVTEEQ